MNSTRPATLADIEELTSLMAEFYRESGYRLDSELSREAFRALIEDPGLGRVWLLLHDDHTAGYIVLTLGFSMEYGGRDAFVDDLFIRPEFRGRGLGELGLEVLLAECRRREVRAVHLEVDWDNGPAKRLYARFGFKGNDRQLLTLKLGEKTSMSLPSAR